MAIKGQKTGKKAGGRKKGQPNATTKKARELIFQAIDEQSIQFGATMKKLQREEPKEWAKIMVKLMDFVLPKKVDVTTDGEALNNKQTQITLSNGIIIDL